MLDGEGSELSVFKTRQACVGADPDVTTRVFNDWSDTVVRQSFVYGISRELTVVPANESVRRADPQSAVSVLLKEADVVALEGGRVLFIEDSEVQTVKTDESLLRSNPKIAILRLHDRLNRVLRQSIFSRPDLMTKLVQTSIRIEGGSAGCRDQKQGCGNAEMS